ncbi:MAG: accessory factor UbiK family protein [Cellvibrionaceae bacterium]|nr:accessory factor UbiK family protein [Cellvibrionaceae bacterium]MCV6627299.1 accessory factor UbiK family protein [Cellvibrionaceae bacterium]
MLQDFAQKLASDIHTAIESGPTPKDHLQQMIQAAVKRLNLVSREEFDTQAIVLQRSRSKIEAMEKQLAELQAQLDQLSQP